MKACGNIYGGVADHKSVREDADEANLHSLSLFIAQILPTKGLQQQLHP